GEHSPDVPALTFVEHNFDPTILLSRAQHAGALGSEQLSRLPNSRSDPRQQSIIDDRFNLHVIGLIDMRLWRGDSRRPRGVIREQQQTFTGFIKSSDRRQPIAMLSKKRINRFSTLFVMRR